jgi:hypothetical protein
MRLLVSFRTPGEDGTCISQIFENNVQRDEMELRKLRTQKVNLDNVWDRFEMHCFICHSFTSLLTKSSHRSTFRAWSIVKIPSILKFNHKNHLLLSSPENQAAIATRHLTSHTLLIRNYNKLTPLLHTFSPRGAYCPCKSLRLGSKNSASCSFRSARILAPSSCRRRDLR